MDASLNENNDKSKEGALEAYEMDEEVAVKERLNPDQDMASPSKVKFTAVSDGKYGEAKIDVSSSYSTSVGLSKEELKQYANDPFWVRLRLFLFILFWVIWFAILIGAIVIIAVTPKCDSIVEAFNNTTNETLTTIGTLASDVLSSTVTTLIGTATQ